MLPLLLAAFLSSSAVAAPCPWEGTTPTVLVSKKSVTVNGIDYPIKAEKDLKAFQSILTSCKAADAAVHLDNARLASKRATRAYIASGVLVVVGVVSSQVGPIPLWSAGVLAGVGFGEVDIGTIRRAIAHDSRQQAANAIVAGMTTK